MPLLLKNSNRRLYILIIIMPYNNVVVMSLYLIPFTKNTNTDNYSDSLVPITCNIFGKKENVTTVIAFIFAFIFIYRIYIALYQTSSELNSNGVHRNINCNNCNNCVLHKHTYIIYK